VCVVALATESQLKAARVLPRGLRRQLSPPGTGSSGVAMCPEDLAPASWLMAAPEPPRIPWLSTGHRP
jgi:hypothetical protein